MHKLLITLAVAALLLAGCAPAAPTEGGLPADNTPAPVEPTAYPAPVSNQPAPTAADPESYLPPETVYVVPTDSSSYPYPEPEAPVSSDSGQAAESPYAPQPGDESLTRGNVFPDLAQSELLVMESFPVQATALLRGNLPDPCHQLRAVITVDEAQKRVDIELYSLADPAKICITVLEPFEANLPLGSFSGGDYNVYVNGELLGTIDL
ncbi:MAG TPA: hypothetical protein PKM21_11850 [Anaerolineales bacterium]|nr:hypothetical protein [Anaerolineales bacterium]